MSKVTAGHLGEGIPFLSMGQGPPLVMVQGLTPTHDVPTGIERRMALSAAAPLAADFRVFLVNRKQGLRTGESMADIAGHLAAAVETELGEPVFLTGTSTGGSVALQLSVDRPELVRALGIVASAYRLGPRGRHIQQEMARRIQAGDSAGAFTDLISSLMPPALRGPLRPIAHALGSSMAPKDASDVLVTLEAEDVFDVGEQLALITAPTLVIGGGKDAFYPRQLFERTAAGVQNGRAHIYPNWGHMRTASSSTTTHLLHGFLLAGHRH